MAKASLPQGTRDFDATTIKKRRYIMHTIEQVFEQYGFAPLETPAMENLQTLMGKYGDEGDKLIFKVLNNGLERPEKHAAARTDFEQILTGKNVASLTERALRYDLTIPFARYVAMNHGKLNFPFKRYQMQPVWRADRPQRGRYREFYQCDADVVGSHSLLNEVELTCIYATVFEKLGIPVEIRINNRKLLAAVATACGGEQWFTPITVAIDKLDKIGIEKVCEELATKNMSAQQLALITKYLAIEGTAEEKMAALQNLLGQEALAVEALQELTYVIQSTQQLGITNVQIDPTLARGLNYYTGTIFEIKATTVQMGSIGGGGRYNDLTSMFGVPNTPGVGISFGVDRIYDVIEELSLFPQTIAQATQVLFFNTGETELPTIMQTAFALRAQGIRCEIYHETAKWDKQFKYAERNGIPLVAIMGSQEIENKTCVIKQLANGTQETVNLTQLPNYLVGLA
jgi:histidyl-tRNA synthetase